MESNSISWLLHLTTPNLPSREVGFRVFFGLFFLRRRVSGPLSPMIPNKLPLPQWRGSGVLQKERLSFQVGISGCHVQLFEVYIYIYIYIINLMFDHE